MTRLTLTAAGTAAPDEVWQRYLLPSRWSEWSPQIRRVEVVGDRLAAGLTGTVVGPAGLRVSFVVDEVDEAGRSWLWTVRLGPILMRLHHGVRLQDDGRTATSLRIDGPLPVVLGYAPVAQFALQRLVRP